MSTWIKKVVSLVLAACMMMGVCAFGEEAEIVDAAAEPVVAEQVTEEPVVEEPVVEEPVVEEPVVEEPAVEEPVVEEPVVAEQVTEEPVVEEPVVEEPVVEEPVVEEPVVEETVVEEPVVEEPVVEKPVVEEPVVEEPVTEEPVVEEPVVEEPVIEDPVVEEPVVEDPVSEETVVEESVIEEIVVEEAEDALTEIGSQDESLLTGYTERYDHDDGSYTEDEYDDETDEWISETFYNADGVKEYTSTCVDENINRTDNFGADGNLTDYEIEEYFFFDGGGLAGLNIEYYDINGELTKYSEVEFIGNYEGRVACDYRPDGSMSTKEVVDYDEFAEPLTKVVYEYDENENLISTAEYEIYDQAKGIWTLISVTFEEDFANTTNFVTRMYDVVLERTPDDAGLLYWVNSLAKKERAAGEIVDGFFNSDEYKNSGKSNEEIVQDCYHAMLDRDADEGGREYWENRLNVGMTAQTVLNGFVGSQEFMALCDSYSIDYGNIELHTARDQNYERTYFVYRLYANCLGREPDTDGQENWCAALMNGSTGSDVAYGFVFSEEMKNKHLDNDDYVEAMYETLMGRASDAAGKADWVGQLNYTRTREHIFNGFLFSQEFQQQCAVAEIALGNQIAEPDDSVEWQFNVDVLRLCNEQRANNGLANLTTREDLWEDVAMVRANELPSLWSHDRPDGSGCDTAMEDAGLSNWRYFGENIAYGFGTAEATVDGWMHSDGHRANILNENYENLATGFVQSGSFACQNFATFWPD